MNRPAFMFDDVCISPDRQIGKHSHPQWELVALSLGGEAYNKVHDLMMAMRGITPNAQVSKMIDFNRLFRNKYNRTPKSVRTENNNDTH